MLLASRAHTEGDVRRWTISYDDWLDNAAAIQQIDVESSSPTCTISNTQVLGREIVFYLNGGVAGETVAVRLTMTDTFDNIKTDTVAFTVVGP